MMFHRERLKKVLVRMLWLTVFIVVGFVIVFAGFIYFLQRSIIYHPSSYGRGWKSFLGEEVKVLEFRTSQGKQTAFYLAPEEGGDEVPEFLWVAFHGNASTALDWDGYLNDPRSKDQGFLLIDYPGYGASDGTADPRTILETSEKAFESLAEELSTTTEALEEKMGVIGYSLGSCTSMQFAANHPMKRIILIAPLTSTLDRGKEMVPFPLYHLLTHRFDNVARLEEVLDTSPDVEVFIFHGNSDRVVPVKYGRELARQFPHCVQYSEYDSVDHGFILDVARHDIMSAVGFEPEQIEGTFD